MIDTEFLSPEEVAEVTGYKNAAAQRNWLDINGWKYVLTGSQRPIVGRWFARMRLAGVQPTCTGGVEQVETWMPDFSALMRQ